MWFPARETSPGATAETIVLADAKGQCNLADDETAFDAKLTDLITVARTYVEAYCGALFVSREMQAACDAWSDLERLPFAPVTSVVGITYVDVDGQAQTLDDAVYELRADDLEASIVLAFGAAWPATRPGSRITVTAMAGYGAPESEAIPAPVRHAMLMFIAQMFETREPATVEGVSTFDYLLCNYRRFG